MSDITFLNEIGTAELVAKIKAKYAKKTDVPTKVSDLTNDSNYQTETQVNSAITSAIAGVTEFDYEIVSELPEEGEKGIIYLVPNSGSDSDLYDEYIWIVTTVGSSVVGRFEKFGEKQIESVEYIGDTTNITVTDGTGADAGKKVISISAAVATSLGLADTALQPGDLVPMTNEEIDALFEDTSSSGSQG